jgi:Rrf2 family protein
MALIHLSRDGDGYCSAREISDNCHIPLPLLMNILKVFAQQDIVSSTRGINGGYKLSTPSHQLSLLRIVQVLEGSVKLVQCVSDQGEKIGFEDLCEMTGCCSIRSPLLKIHEEFERFLDNITLARIGGPRVTEVRVHAGSGSTV